MLLSECAPWALFCPNTSLCIEQRFVCNGHRDCPDGFDEIDCEGNAFPHFSCIRCGETVVKHKTRHKEVYKIYFSKSKFYLHYVLHTKS